MGLDQPIETLPKTSFITIKKLKSLDIETYFDLINYFPFRYENFQLISKISRLQEGEAVTVIGQVESAKNNYVRRGLTLQKVKLFDETGKIEAIWYNQPYLINLFQKFPYLAVGGGVKKSYGKMIIEPKEYETLKNKNAGFVHVGRIVPVYPEKRGLSSRTLREKVRLVLSTDFKEVEFLPQKIIDQNQLIAEKEAYEYIHFPTNFDFAKRARKRLSFDELFAIQLSALLVKKNWQRETVGHELKVKKFMGEIEAFSKSLPFILTSAQQKVIVEILKDLSSVHPMNRFLQGDVGSGKTVVATVAAYITYLNGFQTLFMAPTEILTNQHYNTIFRLVEPLKVKVGLRTAASKTKNLDEYGIVIGTHALLNEKLNFKKVGLVIVDEQHRFGVRQRAILKDKGINPHLLTMTATPIPRTVSLTLYGELDISVLDEMPKGRIPVKTYVVPKHKREDMHEWLKKKILAEKIQVFIVCPLIEESEYETMRSVKAAKKEYETVSEKIFPDFRVGLLHGKMKSYEKDEVMKKFKDNYYNILVCTSVVEVGIDIPNATIMVIEAAERYGLAQLHQLRGRIGRADKQS